MKNLLYFGCIKESGHYLWVSQGWRVHGVSTIERYTEIKGVTHQFINGFDGVFFPAITSQGVYRESLVPPFRIIAWHDYTIDSRPGSNSALLGIGFSSADEMIDEAAKDFPSVMSRQVIPLISENQFSR